MASIKRTVLDTLKRKRLLEIADGEGIELPNHQTLPCARDALLAADVDVEAVLFLPLAGRVGRRGVRVRNHGCGAVEGRAAGADSLCHRSR